MMFVLFSQNIQLTLPPMVLIGFLAFVFVLFVKSFFGFYISGENIKEY